LGGGTKPNNLIEIFNLVAAAGRSFILLVQNKRTKQKDSPCLPCGFPALLDLVGHDGNSLRSNSRHADPTSSAMLGFA